MLKFLILGEILTIIESDIIFLTAKFNYLLKIANKNYKFKDFSWKFQTKENKISKILMSLALLIPGINLLIAIFKSKEIKNYPLDIAENSELIIPMTENEKETYQKLNNKIAKIIFLKHLTKQIKSEENNYPKVISLYQEELKPLNYTLNEVKRLNSVTNCSYRLGRINGKNIAIIGIPNPQEIISKIEIPTEEGNMIYNYIPISEIEAEGQVFSVYPFNNSNKEFQEIIEDIKAKRIPFLPIIDLDREDISLTRVRKK